MRSAGYLMTHDWVGVLNMHIFGPRYMFSGSSVSAFSCSSSNLGVAGEADALSLGNCAWTFPVQPSERLSSPRVKINIILALLFSSYHPLVPFKARHCKGALPTLRPVHLPIICLSHPPTIEFWPSPFYQNYTPILPRPLFPILCFCYPESLPVI